MNTPRKTMVIGASENTERYANIATKRLIGKQHTVVLLGTKEGNINQIPIFIDKPIYDDIDTVTLYVGSKNQDSWKEYILALKPKRVIFNPGTENPEFYKELEANNIEVVVGCTLVMLSTGQY
jgi:uncharacterized protein